MSNLNIEQQIESKESEIKSINEQIEKLKSQLDNFEYQVSEEEFDDFLDDYYEDVTVVGMEFCVSYVLKSCDPVTYRCMKSDYESNYDAEDCAEWREMYEDLADLQGQLEYLESELEDLQDELED